MRTPSTPLLAILAASLLVATSAHAQFGMRGAGGAQSERMLTFGLGGGVAVPVSDAKDAFKNGFNGLAYARIKPHGLPFSFGVHVSFQKFDLKSATVSTQTGTRAIRAGAGPGAVGIPSGTSGTGQLIGGVGEVKLNLVHGPVSPYLLAGVGGYNVKTDVNGTGGGTDSNTRFGVNGGAGISAQLGQLGLFVQARFDNVFTQKGVIDTKSIQVVPVTLGLQY